MESNFLFDLIASLKKTQSKKQIKEDIKNLGDFKLPLIGTLNKAKTKSQIKQDLSSLNGTVSLTGKIDNKNIATSMQQATQQAQKQVNAKPIEMSFSVKKEKLLNDIKLLAQQNSKLFKDTDMSIKYNSLLDSAEMARNNVELSTLRTQLGSLRSELKVTGNAGLTMTDALKNGLSKVLQLFGSHGIIVQFTAQLRKAWTEAKELDKSMTDLSRVNVEITRSGFPDYLDRVIDKTKQLAVATKDYIDAVTTFSRAGYNLTASETLADMAVQLEKVGDMSAVDASKALLAGLQGYIEIDGYGMDQLAEKAQALNDKIDLIGNTGSITQAELASGIQAVGSVMNDANTSVDEFLALLGAGNRAVQDSNKVALAIRTSALRIRGCTAELEEMGEETDSVIESTSTLAEKIKGLTNINGNGGVNILEADEETFRSIYDIYNDISKVYDKMSDKNASALLDLIAGKNRSNQISAILQNMSEANELLERSLSAAGTASAEYEIYLDSAEAACEKFGVSMTETYSNIISGDTVKGLANAGTAVLDFANSWGILEGTLKGFLALGILKGVTTLTVAFKNSTVQISNYGKALDNVSKVSSYAQDTTDYAKALNTLKASCVNLTDAQLKQVLANRNLSESQLIEILQLKGLESEEKNARLAQLGLIQTTETQTVAQGAATASTFSLSAAIKGLGESIKRAWMTNPVGIIIMGISTAIGVATSAVTKHNQKLEETRQSAEKSANAYKESASSIEDYTSRYQELHKALIAAKGDEEETYNIKKQLLDLQTELNDKFGDEYGAVNLVTDAYKDQTETLKEYNKEVAKTYLNENQKGIENATKEMTQKRNYNLGGASDLDSNDKWVSVKDVALKYKDKGIDIISDEYDGSLSIQLTADAGSAYEIINEFESDLREKARELGDEHLFDDILDISSSELNRAKETLDKYNDIYQQALMANLVSDDSKAETYNKALDAVEKYNEAVLRSEDPFSDEKVKNARQDLKEIQDEISSDDSWQKYGAIVEDVFEQADTKLLDFSERLQNDPGLQELADGLSGFDMLDLESLNPGENDSFDQLRESAEEYEISVDELIDSLVRLGYVQGEIESLSADGVKEELSTFEEAWADSFTSENDAVKELGDTLLGLAEKGRLTKEAFNEADSNAGGYFKNLGISADEAVAKINQLVDEAKQLSSMSSQISSMADALSTKREDGFVSADTLAGFDVEVRGLESWDRFQSVLGSTTSSYEECQEAANALATEWVNSSDFLAQLTEQNEEYYKTQLEAMGIENYEEVIAYAQALNEAKEVLSQSSLELGNATQDEIEALIAEGQYSELTANMILALYDAKIAEQAATIDTSADCENLIALAGDTDRTSQSIQLLIQLMNIYSGLESGAYNGNRLLREEALAEVDRIKGELEKIANGENDGIEIEPTVKLGNRGKSSAKSAGKKAADEYLDAFEKELEKLKTLREQGKITEKQYLDYLRKLYQRFFRDKKKYAEQYAKYEHEYLQGMKSLYESALSGVTSILDKQISAYGDARDAAVESLEQQRDAAIEVKEAEKERYEQEIDLIDKQIAAKNKVIDGIRDEIDAMREANEKKKQAINLQQDEFILQRMLNQRSKQVYKDGQFVFETDTSGIREAKQKVEDDKLEIAIANKEKEIKLIEKEISLLEERKSGINDQIDLLDKEIDQINDYFNKMISDTEKYWNDLIKGMQDYKSRWEELAEIEEQAKIVETLRALGIETGDILGMSEEAFAKFKDEYIGILADIYSGNDNMLSALSDTTGRSVDEMGSYLDATQGYIDSLSGIGESLNPVAEAVGNVDENMGSLSSTASEANENLTDTASKTAEVASNVESVSNSLNEMPESGKVSGLGKEFDTLADSIGKVAEALGIGEGSAIGTLFQAMSNLNTVTLGSESEGIIGQFTLLKKAITDVIDTIGLSEEQAVGSLMGAITQLNSITLDESIIKQFTNLKTAIDSVTTAISGGGGESSGGEGQGSSGSKQGGESGGKSSKGNGEGGGNSLTGAIEQMGETANTIIGEPDAEGDGTVIGEFGSMETAVNDVTSAIGSGDSEGSEGQGSSGESEGNLIGSIIDLGETTNETLGEPDGDGVIGRFGEFKDVIAEADDHVHSISDGLDAIDGKEVECTITVNVKQNGHAYAEGTVLGSMNLNSGEYTAKYGKAFAEGTGKYEGLPKAEKNALVSEYGQTEMTVLPDGKTIITDEPTMMDLPKDTVIYNEEQTKKIMDNKIDVSGNAHTDGPFYTAGEYIRYLQQKYPNHKYSGDTHTNNTDDGSWIGADGHKYRDLQPGDRAYELKEAFDPIVKKMQEGHEEFLSNAYFEHTKQMEKWTKEIANNQAINNVINNRNIQQPVINGGINITCPGVTSKEVAQQVGVEVDRIFNGMHLEAEQRSRMR